MVHIELDVLTLVIDSHEHIKPATLKGRRKLLTNDVFEILVFAGSLDVNIEITVVHAFDLDQHRQIRCLGASGPETGHAIDHEFTS